MRVDSAGTFTVLARAGFEVAGVTRDAGGAFALIVTTSRQRAELIGLGLTVLAPPPPALRAPPTSFRDFAAIAQRLENLANAHAFVTLDTLGFSVEARPILGVKIGPAADVASRANVLFVGAHHAREWISAELMLRFADYLVDSVSNDPGRSELVSQRDVWVVPVLNPDGYQYSFDVERLWRKNRRPNGDGSVGVDLNRNYPAFWGRDDIGSSGSATAETYRGPGPGSEPEVAAMIAFHAVHPPDAAVSYHSYTNLVLYPYSHQSGRVAADQSVFEAFAGTPLAPAIRDGLTESARPLYHPGPGWRLYPTNGDYTEWAYRAHGTIAFTVELTAGCCLGAEFYGFEFPDDSASVARVFEDNLPFALAVLDGAATVGRSATASLESLWPSIRVVGPAGAGATLPVSTVTSSGSALANLVADSLSRGTVFWRWEGPAADVRPGSAVAVPAFALNATVLGVSGQAADSLDSWTGWRQDTSSALVGHWAWRGFRDTLRSPAFDLREVGAPTLTFSTRHAGSLFSPGPRGRAQISIDDGASWLDLAVVEGAAPAWYVISLRLPAVSDRVRLRLIADSLDWWVDAIHLFGETRAPVVASSEHQLTVSQNPVRTDQLFFAWAPVAGRATLRVFTFAGDLVFRSSVSAEIGVLEWDLRNRQDARVENGAYVAVLELPTEQLRRRVFVARSP
ncbi:MAG TPA: M14 family metallopeptidase [Gemmatimonadales bacterium]